MEVALGARRRRLLLLVYVVIKHLLKRPLRLSYPSGIVLPLGLKPVQAERWVKCGGDSVGA